VIYEKEEEYNMLKINILIVTIIVIFVVAGLALYIGRINLWIKCDDYESLSRYLKNEKVQKIAFCGIDYYNDSLPVSWWTWGEIAEPERINKTLQLIHAGKLNGIMPIACNGSIVIITDKHKFLMPAEWDNKKVYSHRWESAELRKQLRKWGFPDPNGTVQEYNYSLPPKAQTVAILLYPHKVSTPLALFGDKILAENLLFEKEVKEPNGIVGIAGLHKNARLRAFGIESRKENGKIIISNELKPKKIFEGREWLEKIMDSYEIALKEAEEREKYFPMEIDDSVGRIVFMTQDKDYWKEIGVDANSVYDDYIRSEQLKAYFDELGLTKELLSTNPR